MVSKPRLCNIFETALLTGWIEISSAWRSSFCEPDVARTRRCEGCVVQDQATHASKDDGKSEGGSPPLARIRATWRRLNRWHSGIGLRLLARVLLFSSAITLLLTLLQLYFDYRRDVGTIDRQISEIEGSYRRSLGEGLWNLDARQLELQVDGILHLPDIRFVEVREATDRTDPMVVTAGSHQANADVHREFPIFHINRGAEQTLGVLSIEATLDDVYRRLFDTAIVILISQGAKTFVVSFFILYIVNRLITRHLVTAAKFVGGYDLRRSPPPLRLERCPPRQVDELDQLVGAFNRMCASLQTAYGELRDSEQRFRDYTEMASDWAWATDREHRLTFFSEHSGAFGYDWGKLIGKRRWEVAVDFASDPEKWREHIAILERREPFRDFVYENRRTDGSPGIISVSGKPAFDAEGRFSGYRGVAVDITERKESEEERARLRQVEANLVHELRQSEKELRDVIETVPAMVWSALPDGSNTFVNRRWTEYTGFSGEEMSGSGWQAALHPEDLVRHVEKWRVSVVTGETFEGEARFRRTSDGEYRWFLVRGVPLRDEQGNILKWYGILTDIEERKCAERALQESERHLGEAQRLARTGSFIWDTRTGEALHVSDEWYCIYGFDPEKDELARKEWLQRLHPEDRGAWQAAVNRARDKKSDYDVEYRIVLPNGITKYLHAVGHPVLDSAGVVVHITGSVTDITERKRAEQALMRSEAYLAETQKLTHTGSWAWDPRSHTALYCSEEMFRIFGLNPKVDLPTRKTFRQRVHPEDRDRVDERFLRSLREKVDSFDDYRVVMPDGIVKYVNSLGHPVLDENGELIEFVGTAVDVTERKRAEQERERLRQLEADLAHINRVTSMGELTASLAHEINQPIAAAINDANACRRWLTRDQPRLEEAREAAKNVVESASRAAEIIDHVRSFYKKGGPPQRELVDLTEIAREMLMLVRNEANQHAITLSTNLVEIPKAMADRVQLQQVFMNLMLNGIEAMKETAGELTVTSQLVDKSDVLISVSDTGVGLPAGKADEIFTAFFTTKPQGTGMGLAICRSIIESHGGRLWATDNPGRGATFYFTLPGSPGRT
jgi:PAS domain S-box-containing protein